ncbi:unnamed protein product [Diamesa hyperborea]
MKFKLSVLTLILIVFSVQANDDYENHVIDMEELTEACFKEVNITDIEIKRQVRTNPNYSYPEKHCYDKCLSVGQNVVTEDGVLVLKTIKERLENEDDIPALVKKCKKVAKKKKHQGPCEVYYAGYKCVSKIP